MANLRAQELALYFGQETIKLQQIYWGSIQIFIAPPAIFALREINHGIFLFCSSK
jgi:hypothetical protein